MVDRILELNQVPELLNMAIVNIEEFSDTLKSEIITKINQFYNINFKVEKKLRKECQILECFKEVLKYIVEQYKTLENITMNIRSLFEIYFIQHEIEDVEGTLELMHFHPKIFNYYVFDDQYIANFLQDSIKMFDQLYSNEQVPEIKDVLMIQYYLNFLQQNLYAEILEPEVRTDKMVKQQSLNFNSKSTCTRYH